MPCARVVRGPMCGLGTGSTDWHLCSLRFSSWISSSLSDRRCSSSRILSSFSSSSLAKSPSSSLMVPGCSCVWYSSLAGCTGTAWSRALLLGCPRTPESQQDTELQRQGWNWCALFCSPAKRRPT